MTFDNDFPDEEKLPREFEIEIVRLATGKYRLQWNGVFIGGSLVREEYDYNGYRFHDVFHLANAAVLHWSPVFRSMIKRKRKSNPLFDECQDGGRAIVVEEGLTKWIFLHAIEEDYFKGYTSIPEKLLREIAKFVQGLEVASCPPELWQRCILMGYNVFREILKNDGGLIVGNMEKRKIYCK